MSEREVMVVTEYIEGKLADVSLELICKATDLAGKLGARVSAVLIGKGVSSATDQVFSYGADVACVADMKELKHYCSTAYTKVVCDFVNDRKPEVVLYGASHYGRDLAPRVASKLRTGLTADCTGLDIGNFTEPVSKKEYKNLLLQVRPAFGGSIIATIVCADNRPQMSTVREGVMPMHDPDPSRRGETVNYAETIDASVLTTRVIKRQTEARKVNLKGANVIVSGGAGVGSKADFKLIFDLAHALGGEVGASRAAVDYGYITKDRQVGQTGTTVRPKLYIAAGISGSIQHQAGMAESGAIVAINIDADAPIFSIAHYGIVGDLKDVIPRMIKAARTE